MKTRPVLKVEKTVFERLFDWVAIVIFITITVYLLLQWPTLPNRIPIHFDPVGEPDGWGPRWTIFLLPVIGAVLWTGMSVIEKKPHLYNYLKLTEQNVQKQYSNSQLFVNVIKNEILVFFSLFTWLSLGVARGEIAALGLSFPLFIVVVFGSIGFFIIRSLRL